MTVKIDVTFDELPPRIPGATMVCKACCEHVRVMPVTAADGLPAVEAFCGARRHPSLMIRDGKVIGTSA